MSRRLHSGPSFVIRHSWKRSCSSVVGVCDGGIYGGVRGWIVARFSTTFSCRLSRGLILIIESFMKTRATYLFLTFLIGFIFILDSRAQGVILASFSFWGDIGDLVRVSP